MAFNSKDLKKLDEFRKDLPKSSRKINAPINHDKKNNHILHPIETEENPEKLFKEIIKASTNGEVPSHLLKRLKELENKQLVDNINPDDIHGIKVNSTTTNNKDSFQSDLYTSFQMLLLEEE